MAQGFKKGEPSSIKGMTYEEIYGKEKAKRIKKKVSNAKKGEKNPMWSKRTSEETKQKIRKSHKKSGVGKWMIGKHHSEETKKKISEANMGHDPTYGMLGRHHSEATRIRLSKMFKGKKGPNWKGGVTPLSKRLRKSIEFKNWRESVFERDDYTCWICERKGEKLHPHHLKKWSDYPKLRFVVSNGLTLCEFCHKIYTSFGKNKAVMIEPQKGEFVGTEDGYIPKGIRLINENGTITNIR